MKTNVLILMAATCLGSSLHVLAKDYEKISNEAVKVAEKTESNNKVLSDIYSGLKVKILTGESELIKFDDKLSELIKEFNLEAGDEDQSRRFWLIANDFASRYGNNFPVGRIKIKILDKVHMKKGFHVGEGFFEEKEVAGKSGLYHSLSDVFMEKAKILGTSFKAENIKKANELARMSILLSLESDFSYMRGLCISRLSRDVERSSFAKKFFEQNRDFALFSRETGAHTVKVVSIQERAAKLISEIAAKKRAATEAERRAVQAALEDFMVLTESDYSSSISRYNLVKFISWLQEISVESSDADSKAVADRMLLHLSEKAPSPEMKQWAKEALVQNPSK